MVFVCDSHMKSYLRKVTLVISVQAEILRFLALYKGDFSRNVTFLTGRWLKVNYPGEPSFTEMSIILAFLGSPASTNLSIHYP